jgi:hypothetical protein
MSSGAVVAVEKAGTPLGLPRELFWDVDPACVETDCHARWIICRVVERGGLKDWKKLRTYYGDEAIKEAVVSARNLSPQSVAFCCAVFGLRKEDFRCFTSRPFPETPWIY